MAQKIVLAFTVNVAGSPLGPVGASSKLGLVQLYTNATTDPVLGQLFGLTVASDAMTHDAVSATRTITLNMGVSAGSPVAPPPFPCHPDTAVPPTLPYVLRRRVTLPGEFTLTNGSTTVAASENQVPSLSINDVVEFTSQPGVLYTVAGSGTTSITLGGAFSGASGVSTGAKVVAAPSVISALYSSSPLDTGGAATDPAIPAGSGARTVSITYLDSLGAGPFTVVTTLTGRRPAPFVLNGGSIDIATITAMNVASVGAFANSVGQITLVELSENVPALLADTTPAEFLGELTDEAQNLIARPLVYLPPSFFSQAQQSASTPQLAGDFLVTTGSDSVPTTSDQTAALAAGNTLQFASQPGVDYTVSTVSAKIVKLTTAYSGLDYTATRDSNTDKRPNDITARAQKQATGAYRTSPTAAAPPTNAQLASALAQYVNPGNAVPPPSPPLAAQTMSPSPTLLSDLFTETLQLALAVPVIPSVIAFA